MDPRPSNAPEGSRRAIRRAVSLECELVTARWDEPLRYVATDLSVTGMWLHTADPVRSGEIVVVCFHPDDGEDREIHTFAEVARVMTARSVSKATPGVGMGLELLDLTRLEAARLEAWLATFTAPVPRRRRPVARPSGGVEVVANGESNAPLQKLPSCWR
ncbi:MAG: PilZ domain-containing protein [Deltaproteobacteria bacterium]|nr:PilZ domain-containing protein [Deltaproteobacteria bacterium]